MRENEKIIGINIEGLQMKSIRVDSVFKTSKNTEIIDITEDKKILFHKCSGKIIPASNEVIEVLKLYQVGKELTFFMDHLPNEINLLKALIVSDFLECEELVENLDDDRNEIKNVTENSINIYIDNADSRLLEVIDVQVSKLIDILKETKFTNIQFIFNEYLNEEELKQFYDTIMISLKNNKIYPNNYLKTSKLISKDFSIWLKQNNIGVGVKLNENSDLSIGRLKLYKNSWILMEDIKYFDKLILKSNSKDTKHLVYLSAEDLDFKFGVKFIEEVNETSILIRDNIIGFWNILIENYKKMIHYNEISSFHLNINISINDKGISLNNDTPLTKENISNYITNYRLDCYGCFLENICNGNMKKHNSNYTKCEFARNYFKEHIKGIVRNLI